jgi:hypothetical protein
MPTAMVASKQNPSRQAEIQQIRRVKMAFTSATKTNSNSINKSFRPRIAFNHDPFSVRPLWANRASLHRKLVTEL